MNRNDTQVAIPVKREGNDRSTDVRTKLQHTSNPLLHHLLLLHQHQHQDNRRATKLPRLENACINHIPRKKALTKCLENSVWPYPAVIAFKISRHVTQLGANLRSGAKMTADLCPR